MDDTPNIETLEDAFLASWSAETSATSGWDDDNPTSHELFGGALIRALTPEIFLDNFPYVPAEEAFKNPQHLAKVFGLERIGQQAVDEAYDVTRYCGLGSYMTWVGEETLKAMRELVARSPEMRFGFVARDGHSMAAAVRGLDYNFFRIHCKEIILSRKILQAVVADYEKLTGVHLALGKSVHGYRQKTEGSSGSYANLTRYLYKSGFRVGEAGSEITLVDNGWRGSTQSRLQEIYPGTDFRGIYMFYSQSPDDPDAGRKRGLILNLAPEEWKGGPVDYVPRDPDRTFESMQAIFAIEEVVCGPKTTATKITSDGPYQPPALYEWSQPPALVDPLYLDPKVRTATLISILLEIGHHPLYEPNGNLRPFTEQVRSWVLQDGGCHPRFAALTNSFTPRWPGIYELEPHSSATGATSSPPGGPT